MYASMLRPQDPHWYAVYTRSRHEKRVEQMLRRMDLETYLPLRKTWGSRPDTRQIVEEPALPGYLFVHCSLSAERRAAIKRSLGVIRLVENAGRPCVIPPEEVASLRRLLESDEIVMPHAYLCVGDRVRVTRGPFEGAVGYVTRVETGKPRLVVAIGWIHRAVAVQIDLRCVERAT
jgi:transcription antitermination factor NusG